MNLLPHSEQKHIRREYYMRVAVVGSILLSSVTVMGILMIVPSYILAHNERVILEEQHKEVVEGVKQDTTSQEVIKTMNHQIERADELISKKHIASIFAEIVHEKPPGAFITGLYQEKGSAKLYTVDVRGVADTRATLLSFQESLKNNRAFDSVTIPISNFAKSKNIPFTITLTISDTHELQ